MRKPRILVIDDNKDFIECVQYYFNEKKCELITALDGEKGLACLEGQIPDCIVLDILMPHKTGYDVYVSVRRRYPSIPIIMCTSTGLTIKKSLNDPLVTHLKKPFEMTELAKSIKKVLHSNSK